MRGRDFRGMPSDPTLLTTPDGTTWRAPTLASADRQRVAWGGFPEFVRLAAPRVPLVVDYRWEWCQDEMARHAQALFEGRTDTLITNVPPGVGKSVVMSVLFPAWIPTQDVSFQIMSASFDIALAHQHSEWTRDMLRSRWFVERWGDLLLTDTNRALYFLRDRKGRKGGYRFATSVGSKGVGRHGQLYSIDDPLKPADVQKATGKEVRAMLDRANEWLGHSVISRAGRDIQRLSVVMQRLHEDDPSGFLLGRLPGVTHLMLPYLFERDRRCVTKFGGDRRHTAKEPILDAPGLASKYARTVALEGGTQGLVVQSQYQQNPTPDGGIIFDPTTYGVFDPRERPFKRTLSVLSVDATFGKKHRQADFVAIEAWGYDRGDFLCYHSDLERRSFVETVQAIVDLLVLFPAHAILVEDAANGPAIVETLQAKFPNVVAVGVGSDSKESRARAASHMFTARRVKFAAGAEWVERKLQNLTRFPNASHDDDVDATTQAILWMLQEYVGPDGGAFDVAVDEWAAEKEAARAQPFGLAGAVDRARAEAVFGGLPRV